MERKITLKRICKYSECNVIVFYREWQDKVGRGKFCSRRCLALDTASKRDSKLAISCLTCEKELKIWSYQVKEGLNRYCSNSCRSKSPQNLLKLKKIADTLRGKPSVLKGLKRPDLGGENHPSWIKDRTKLVQSEKKHLDGRYREWMKAVKDRDNWKCRIADENCKGRMEAHHILRWTKFLELRYEVNNGITLCHFHHPRKINDERNLASYFRELVKAQ